MAKLRYPFDTAMPNVADEPWTKLDTIVEHLQDGEPIPPDLASWLGEAIHHAKRDPAELLRRLGLKRGRGPVAADPNAWHTVGKRICDLEDDGLSAEKAIVAILEATGDKFSRTMLQKWRAAYRRAKREANFGTNTDKAASTKFHNNTAQSDSGDPVTLPRNKSE